jgi:DNA-binding Lrp family transcriptional regulator
MARTHLDEIDYRILAELQEHARISNVTLADNVGLTPAPCLRRVKALEQSGVIRTYATLLNAAAVNLGVTVYVHVRLDRQAEDRLEFFERMIRQQPEVLECHLMAGDADYLLRVVVPDVATYERFLKNALTRVPGVASVKSSFVLRQVKYSTALPLPTGQDAAEANEVTPLTRSQDTLTLHRTVSAPRARRPTNRQASRG